jgi:hypothetical protein
MDAKTLIALQGSIAKWEAIVADTGTDEGPSNCPLCRLFHPKYRDDDDDHCAGCPISDAGFGCSNDEYGAFCLAEDEENHERMHGYAGKELEFLKSLLPTADTEGVKP